MKFFLYFIVITIVCCSCHAQTNPPAKEFYSEMFKWRINIPENFEDLSAEEYSKNQKKGAVAIEKTVDVKVENHSKPIFVIKSDQFHYMESNYQPFNVKDDGDYEVLCKSVDDVVYHTFKEQMPKAQIDTVYSKEKINDLNFLSFKMVVNLPNKKTLTMYMYNRLFYNSKDFTMAILYMDDDKGSSMLNAWRRSTFGK
jgi:hypothetical protein